MTAVPALAALVHALIHADLVAVAELAVAASRVVGGVVAIVVLLVAGVDRARDAVARNSAACPAWQSSSGSQIPGWVQKSASLQTLSSGVWEHVSLLSTQVSTVHVTPSLQSGAVPGWHSGRDARLDTVAVQRVVAVGVASGS